MTKDEILNYVAPNPSSQSEDIELAYQAATVEAIEAKIAHIKNQSEHASAWQAHWVNAMVFAVVLYVLAGALVYFVSVPVGMLGCAFAMVAMVLIPGRRRKHMDELRRCEWALACLQPIAGTDACQEALKFIEADAPGVATWRDIALSERGQLYHFDVDVMRRLHAREEYRLRSEAEPLKCTERQRLNEEACRKVHGLAPLSPVGA